MKLLTAREAAGVIADGATVTVSSSSGLGCPDAVLEAIGARFAETGHPRDLTTIHPIAAGDMYSIRGIDHIARPGLLKRTLCGSYPSGPSSAEPPAIRRMIEEDAVAAYNVPSGILFDMHREAAAKRPGVLTKVGLDTFVDPDREGCAMTPSAAAEPIVRHERFAGEDWLFFPAIAPDVAIIRATTADERGNLTFEHEGAFLGALDQALAARSNGGTVIAQVKRRARAGSFRPQDVRVPGILVDCVVVAPDQLQTTQTVYDPAISGEILRPLDSFEPLEHSVEKVIARRVAMELGQGMTVNLGFGISSNVPRILLEEGRHGAVTWVIEQGAVGGVPLTGFAFGCASNAGDHAVAPPVHLLPGRRLRRRPALFPPDRPRRLGERLQPLRPTARDGGCRRIRGHHRAGTTDRVLRPFRAGARVALNGQASGSSGKAGPARSWTKSNRCRSPGAGRSCRDRTWRM